MKILPLRRPRGLLAMTLSSASALAYAWRSTTRLRSVQPRFIFLATTSRQTAMAARRSSSSNTIENTTTAKHYSFHGHTTSKENKSSVTISFATSGHTITTDLPRPMGGQDRAPQPVEHLLAAWAGCTQATALFVSRQLLSRKTRSLERLEFVNITATREERGALALPIDENPPVPSRIHTITGRIVVWPSFGDDLVLLREQTELRCPVANMLVASGCRMDVQWVNGGSI